jgi:hypothetical protein
MEADSLGFSPELVLEWNGSVRKPLVCVKCRTIVSDPTLLQMYWKNVEQLASGVAITDGQGSIHPTNSNHNTTKHTHTATNTTHSSNDSSSTGDLSASATTHQHLPVYKGRILCGRSGCLQGGLIPNIVMRSAGNSGELPASLPELQGTVLELLYRQMDWEAEEAVRSEKCGLVIVVGACIGT